MAFHSYTERCDKFLLELHSSLSKDDRDKLREVCKEIGWAEYLEWSKRYQERIYAYLRATPTERKNNKDWQDAPDRLLLILASIHLESLGYDLLEASEDIVSTIGESYRTMALVATKAAYKMWSHPNRRWPFPGEDPFANPKGEF